MLSIYLTTLSVCYPFTLRHCQYVIHLRYDTVIMLSIYVDTVNILSIYVTTLSVCYPFMLRHCRYVIHLHYDTVSMLSIYVMTLLVCYPFMLWYCQYPIHLCYDTVSMLSIYVTTLSVCYRFMLWHCQYPIHLCYDTVSMPSIYVMTLSVCYPFMLRHCQYAIHLCHDTVSNLSIYVTTLSVCYPFMLRHCQYAVHFRRFDEFETIFREIIMTKSGGVLIFPERIWAKQRRTVRAVHLYKLLHSHCTEHVVLHACIKHIAFICLQTNVTFAASFTGSVWLGEKWCWARWTEGESSQRMLRATVAAELGASGRSRLGAKLRRVSSWRGTRLVTERQMWSLEIPTSSLWGT
jgi:hypothetical protein